MGDEEQTLLEKQHATILREITFAKGAFVATGVLGVVLLGIVGVIATFAFNKIESNSETTAANTQEIAVIKSESKGLIHRVELLENASFVK